MSGDRLRVLQLLTVDSLAGTELMTCNLVQRMDRSRFEVEVGFTLNDGPLSPWLRQAGITVKSMHGRGGWARVALELMRLARANPPYDVVHLYGFKTSLIGRLAFKSLSRSTIVVHGIRGLHVTQAVDLNGPAARSAILLERALHRLIDYYAANSKGAIEFLSRRGLPPDKFVYLPSGVETGSWPVSEHAPSAVPLIVCVARFAAVKRHADLIEALAILMRQGVSFRCELPGRGPLLDAARSRVASLGLDAHVSFLGELTPEEVRNLLAAADVFALVSAWEGLPGSIMEAMAAGLPVVGTDVNGIDELVIDGETGLLASGGDPSSIAEALRQMLENPALRLEMGRAGRRRIEERFDINSAARKLEAFYVDAVATSQVLA